MSKKSILIIDDDVELCTEITEFLGHQGYQVNNATSGTAGLKLLQKHAYDLLLLDYKMPDLHGIELLKKVKALDPEIKVVFVTGKPFIEKLLETEKVSALVAGVINKPFSDKALLAEIERLPARGKVTEDK